MTKRIINALLAAGHFVSRCIIRVFEWLWVACLVVLAYYVLAVLGGCTSTPLTPLERQVRAEQRMRSCTNAGGIWYQSAEGGVLSGRCQWNPRRSMQ